MRSSEAAKFRRALVRLRKLQAAIHRSLLARIPTTTGKATIEVDAKSDVDKALEHCAKAEKLVNEGKVMAAMKEQAICERLLGQASQ
jgi:hypothetical protein